MQTSLSENSYVEFTSQYECVVLSKYSYFSLLYDKNLKYDLHILKLARGLPIPVPIIVFGMPCITSLIVLGKANLR